jgi:hypothetical protein
MYRVALEELGHAGAMQHDRLLHDEILRLREELTTENERIAKLTVDNGRLQSALQQIGEQCECVTATTMAWKAISGKTLTEKDGHFPPKSSVSDGTRGEVQP